MKTLLVIWRASSRSSTNAFHHDRRVYVGRLVALALQLGSGIWACTHLFSAFTSWQSSISLSVHLWLTCLTAWSMIALLALLATFGVGLNSNEALLLATQPMAPATRLRALYGLIVFKECGNWLIWEACVFGIALAPVIGPSALVWLALMIVGAALAAWLALIATLLVLRLIMPHLRAFASSVAGLLIICGSLLLVLRETGGMSLGPLSGLVQSIVRAPLAVPAPVPVLAALLLLWLLALLPLASMAGRLYISALLIWHNRDHTARGLVLPGIRLLVAQLARSRTLSAALISKGLLNQSRHLLAWFRLLMVLILLALFRAIRAMVSPLHLAPPILVAAYATLVVALMMLEYAPYAISSEGNRLALYLTLPRGISTFLRARLFSFWLPALLLGFSTTLLLGLWMHLTLFDLGRALLLVLILLSGYTTFTVLGSTLDEDLTLTVEDPAQALMQEEMPLTPRRLQFLSLTAILLTAYFWLIWKMPLLSALLALVLIDIAIAWLMWWLNTTYLARILR